jgi:5-methylcytosine-specific restriction endonuclease McrA
VSILFYNGGMTRKIIPSPEMLNDLYEMGDVDFSAKWNVSRRIPIRIRKEYGIKSFNNQYGIREHKFIDGVEYKWCQRGHWELIKNFGNHTSRYDGLRGWCKIHSNKSRVNSYYSNNEKEKSKVWLRSEKGRASRRVTWRKQHAKKKDAYVSWSKENEQRAYDFFGKACGYCWISLEFLEIEFDHFIPLVLGGKTEPENMVPCCKDCNRGSNGKFGKHPKDWLVSRFGDYGYRKYEDIACGLKLLSIQTKH